MINKINKVGIIFSIAILIGIGVLVNTFVFGGVPNLTVTSLLKDKEYSVSANFKSKDDKYFSLEITKFKFLKEKDDSNKLLLKTIQCFYDKSLINPTMASLDGKDKPLELLRKGNSIETTIHFNSKGECSVVGNIGFISDESNNISILDSKGDIKRVNNDYNFIYEDNTYRIINADKFKISTIHEGDITLDQLVSSNSKDFLFHVLLNGDSAIFTYINRGATSKDKEYDYELSKKTTELDKKQMTLKKELKSKVPNATDSELDSQVFSALSKEMAEFEKKLKTRIFGTTN